MRLSDQLGNGVVAERALAKALSGLGGGSDTADLVEARRLCGVSAGAAAPGTLGAGRERS